MTDRQYYQRDLWRAFHWTAVFYAVGATMMGKADPLLYLMAPTLFELELWLCSIEPTEEWRKMKDRPG